MPINSRHPEYLERQDEWVKNRDAFEGSRAIKERSVVISDDARSSRIANASGTYAGSAYLPPLSEQTPSEYAAYRDRGLYHNVTGRATNGFVGIMARLPAKKALPVALEPYFDDATASGISFDELYKTAIEEIIITGRIGFLVDRFTDGRPYIIPYSSESIINWKYNGESYDWVVIEINTLVPKQDDPYEQELETMWLELMMAIVPDEDGFDQEVYVQRVWKAGDKDGEPVIVDTTIPTNRGQTMDKIPFFAVNDLGISEELRKPTISDIADINISHYKTSCDLEHGRHFTALPTPVLSGAPTGTVVKIGSTTCIILPDPKAKAYYMEFNGQGLQSLENAIKEKEQQMSTMSARLIDQNRKGSEAEGTVRMRFAGESNMLNGIALALEGAFNLLYKIIAVMEAENPDDVKIEVNKDFLDDGVSANLVSVIMDMYLNETIDLDSFIYNLRKAEMFDPAMTDEQIREKLAGLNTAFVTKLAENNSQPDQTTQTSDSGDE